MATPAEASRSLASRVGAYALHSKYDSRELTKNARAKFDQRFIDEVDPDRVLPESERLRRAEHARKAYSLATHALVRTGRFIELVAALYPKLPEKSWHWGPDVEKFLEEHDPEPLEHHSRYCHCGDCLERELR